jgi:hypothetical protein
MKFKVGDCVKYNNDEIWRRHCETGQYVYKPYYKIAEIKKGYIFFAERLSVSLRWLPDNFVLVSSPPKLPLEHYLNLGD